MLDKLGGLVAFVTKSSLGRQNSAFGGIAKPPRIHQNLT